MDLALLHKLRATELGIYLESNTAGVQRRRRIAEPFYTIYDYPAPPGR
jgi:hypothetical protein